MAALAAAANIGAPPAVCFVVRTYWGHGDAHGGELRSFLTSLQDQTVGAWEAVLVMVDKTPFTEAYDIIRDLNETSRAWVYTEWIGERYTPKQPDGTWTEGYHGTLYNVTDDAIRACAPGSDWVVATNGDNVYGRHFIQKVIENGQDPSIDLVAFDFYSRYQRPAMPSCERFSMERAEKVDGREEGGERQRTSCKRNTLQWCQTDLGSVAMRRAKLLAEERSFGSVKADAGGLDEAHNDGLTFAELVRDGWRTIHVHDECLFAHNPSFQTCAWKGFVWDDSDIMGTGGGECIDRTEAARRLRGNDALEMVPIRVSHPPNYMDEYRDATVSLDDPADCIRRRDYTSREVWGRACSWFPDGCVDDEDGDEHERGLSLYYDADNADDADDADENAPDAHIEL